MARHEDFFFELVIIDAAEEDQGWKASINYAHYSLYPAPSWNPADLARDGHLVRF